MDIEDLLSFSIAPSFRQPCCPIALLPCPYRTATRESTPAQKCRALMDPAKFGLLDPFALTATSARKLVHVFLRNPQDHPAPTAIQSFWVVP